MGMQATRPGGIIKKDDASVAKNYLTEEELQILHRIVTMYIDFAELQALERKPMTMQDWTDKLDEFLKASGRAILRHAGKVSAEAAKAKAELEYERYHALQDALPRAVVEGAAPSGSLPSAVASRRSALVLLALLGLAPGRAQACSYVETPPFEIDLAEAAVDHEPPGAVPAIEVWFRRGTGAEGFGCFGGGNSSCDDLGEVGLIITPPTDDRTPPGDLDLASVEGTWRSNPGGESNALYFPWKDGAENLQEPIGFVLEVAAVDKATSAPQ
jgi:hypothetical protein